MVMIGFSIPSMIDLIKTGKKTQTTRIPRKLRSNGKPAYSVGEKVQLYYKPRHKQSCKNCITQIHGDMCIDIASRRFDCCIDHSNFFGESEIIDIIHYHHVGYGERNHEVWAGYQLSLAPQEDKEAWAIADGFLSWKDASSWFAQEHSPMWADVNLDVIIWDSKPIIERWQQK